MDLLETTLKVIENQNAARENLTVFKENIEQYEAYINAMKENLEEMLLKNSHNKEILEMNNFTKNSFNENCKIVKDLFGNVYNYTQQIQEKLLTIMDQETSLDETYNENEERCSHLETKYNNSLKLLVILEKDSVEKLTKERSDIQHQLNKINEEFTVLSELWKDITGERDRKYTALQATTLEVEILHNELQANHEEEDLYAKSMEKKREENRKNFEEISKDIEVMDDQLLHAEDDIAVIINGKLKEHLKIKEEMLHNQNEALVHLKKLRKDYLDTEMLISETQDTSLTITKKLTTEIESKKIMITENEKKLMLCNTKKLEISNQDDQIHLKIAASDDMLKKMKIQYEAIHEANEEILKKIVEVEEENEQITIGYEKLLNTTVTCKNDVCKKEGELQELKTSPNIELLQIDENNKKLETDYSSKKLDIQNEIQTSDLHNKQHQQTLEELELTLKDLELQYTQLEEEKNNLIKIKTLARLSEVRPSNVKKETGKPKKVKLIPTPPLQRFPPPQQPKKRVFLDTESDSSADGERLSYAEFMARKKLSRESRKLKR